MPNQKNRSYDLNSEYKQIALDLDLPEVETEGLSIEDARLRSESGRTALNVLKGTHEQPTWYERFEMLINGGWPWRQAVYIAWASSPAQVGQRPRWPETQEKLAQEVLGLSSDRIISKWKRNFPEMQLRIEQMAAAPVLRNLRDIVDAMVTLAKTPDHNTFNDRRMALEIAGVYKPRQRQELTGPNGGAIETQEAKVVVYLPDNGRDPNQTQALRKESE